MNKEKETLGDKAWAILELSVVASFILPWLALVPLFWFAPSAKPEGDDSCTHWESCLEQVQSLSPASGPDQEGDEDGTPAEQEGSSAVGDDNSDTTFTGF